MHPIDRNHPGADELESFMCGELARAEVAGLVRHLLTGCPRCVALTRRLWALGKAQPALRKALAQGRWAGVLLSKPVLKRRGGAVTETEAAAQAALRVIVVALEALRSRLEEVHAALPAPPQEMAMLLGEEETDVSTEVRSVIECVLADNLNPAIRDLAAAASYSRE
jgi:hypothetical protein